MRDADEFYVCDKYLFIYETKEKLIEINRDANFDGLSGIVSPIFVNPAKWSERLKSKITFSNPGEPIFVISKQNKYWNVIIGEKVGWIIVGAWTGIVELKNECK